MEDIQFKVKTYIAKEISKLCLSADINPDDLLDHVRLHLKPKEGDYQFNVNCLHKFKAVKKGKEAILARTWVDQWTFDDSSLITNISSDSGFLSFKLDRFKVIEAVIGDVISNHEGKGPDGENTYGESDLGNNKIVIVEYSSPNIAKPFHLGHLRSTIIGNFLKNLHEMMGYEVIGINYLGDWGKQYGLLALAWEKYGGAGDSELTIQRLFELYVKINKELKQQKEELKTDRPPLDLEAQEYFKKMENGDQTALDLWKKLRAFSIGVYKQTYARLGIEFDVFSGESQQGNLPEVVQILREKNLLVTDEKGTHVNLEKDDLGHAVILKSDGTTLYLTRDLAEVEKRLRKWHFDKCFYVVGTPQQHHFKQFFKLLEMMGSKAAGKCQHIGFGQVMGMKTRVGEVVFLSDILDAAKSKMLAVMKENEEKLKEVKDPETTADQLGISAIIVQDLSAKREQNYKYDEDRMTSFQGETGPYLQYAHARLCSIFRKVDGLVRLTAKADLSLLTEIEAYVLVKQIGQYPLILKKCLNSLEPVNLVEYLMELAKCISHAHKVLQVKSVAEDVPQLAEARLLLFWAALRTLRSGLKVLGLTPIHAM